MRRTARQPVGAPVRKLFPALDARFVLAEIGKLTTKVDRLVDDVGSLGKKVAEVQHQVSFVRGAEWVVLGIVSLTGILLTLIASGKLKISLG